MLDRLRAAGATVEPRIGGIPPQGTILLYGAAGLPGPPAAAADAATIVDTMDHARVERLVLGDALGLEPGDKRIIYVGGDYPPQWLAAEVDAGRAELAVLIAPVPWTSSSR